jgi:hypothetical protein
MTSELPAPASATTELAPTMAKLTTLSPSGAMPSSTSSVEIGDAWPITAPDLSVGRTRTP